MTTTKMVDKRGRVSLGKEFADHLVLVKRLGDGAVQVVLAEAVPSKESWLYKNPEALASVMEGMEQAKARQLGEGPDLAAGQKLVRKIEEQ